MKLYLVYIYTIAIIFITFLTSKAQRTNYQEAFHPGASYYFVPSVYTQPSTYQVTYPYYFTYTGNINNG